MFLDTLHFHNLYKFLYYRCSVPHLGQSVAVHTVRPVTLGPVCCSTHCATSYTWASLLQYTLCDQLHLGQSVAVHTVRPVTVNTVSHTKLLGSGAKILGMLLSLSCTLHSWTEVLSHVGM